MSRVIELIDLIGFDLVDWLIELVIGLSDRVD
jgi:hypothetical protein